MKFFKTLLIFIGLLLVLFLLYKWLRVRPVSYGETVFFAGDDGITYTDQLWLYDNAYFNLDLVNATANGTYVLKQDTIFLDYHFDWPKGPRAFVFEGDLLIPLELDKHDQLFENTNQYLSIEINKLSKD